MTTIYIQDLDHIDFSAGNALRPIHLDEILREEYLNPLGMSAIALAMSFKIPAPSSMTS